MATKPKVLIALVATAALVWMGCVAPTADVRQVNLQGLSMQQLDLGLTLDLNNPNKFSVPVEGVDWGVSLFNIDVASGHATPDQDIPAEGSAQVAVPIVVQLADSTDVARRLVRDREIPWAVDGTCQVRVGGSTVDLDFARAGQWENPLR